MSYFYKKYDMANNVLGTPLETCSSNPMTGAFRDGCCNTDMRDIGTHTVCAIMTDAFLAYTKSVGNDLHQWGMTSKHPGQNISFLV